MPVPLTAVSIDNTFFTYRSTYRIDNRTLKIHREFVSRVPRQVCPPEAEAQITADLNKVRIDVYSGYRFAAMTPRAPAIAEFKSDVIVDQSKQIGFIYDLAVDCAPAAFATITTIEPPKHGKLSVDRGTGLSNFPQSNSRFECNKKPTEGMKITYEPERGFTGDDSLMVEILYADKSVSKRRYAIKVIPKPAPQIAEISRIAVRDQKLRVATLYDLNPDCSVIGIPTVRILEPSKMAPSRLRKVLVFRLIRRTIPALNAMTTASIARLSSICRKPAIWAPTP